MTTHTHWGEPWRVRVDNLQGRPCGAGVLLDERHVLTCAHVVTNADAEPSGKATHVRIRSVGCHPEWNATARVAEESWVYRGGTRRGDVALLRLDEPADCDGGATLWRAPVSAGRVRAYGFPRMAPDGIGTDAELGGAGGRESEWAQLRPAYPGTPWIEKGYSGAGVMALDGEFKDRVIGIVVAEYVGADAKAGWMLPTETILAYLPQIKRHVDGGPASELWSSEDLSTDAVLGDGLRLALTRELTVLLAGTWTGTVVVVTGKVTSGGASWLVRLVRTADPAARPGLSDAELTGAPGDTVLPLGAIDAAYSVNGKSLAEVRHYLTRRFGFPADSPDLARRLMRRQPPVSLVISGVDQAEDPDALVQELLGPLARHARSRGIRLVLGYDARPPDTLPFEVLLDPEPLDGGSLAGVTASQAATAVRQLDADEQAAARLYVERALQFFGPPLLPRRCAPRLRVRLAVVRDEEPALELAAIRDNAMAARAAVGRFDRRMKKLIARQEDLVNRLELHRARAEGHFPAEDLALAALHAPAARGLLTPPIDLTSAAELVERYGAEVERRIDEDGTPPGREGVAP